MANKRDLKKFIRNICGSMAMDMELVGHLFPQINPRDVEQIVIEAAILQATTIRRTNIAFDRSRSDFNTRAEYNKARHEYFRKAYSALLDRFDSDSAELVKHMNSALPEEVREVLKKAAQ